MKLFTTKKDIIAAISDIQATGKKLDDMIQVAACSVIQHVEKHGDITLAIKLVEAMPKGSRVKALIGHMTHFGKMVANEKGDNIEAFDKAAKTDLEGAMEKHWTEFKHNDNDQAFDLDALIISLAKRAAKASEKGGDKVSINPDALATLNTLAESAKARAEA